LFRSTNSILTFLKQNRNGNTKRNTQITAAYLPECGSNASTREAGPAEVELRTCFFDYRTLKITGEGRIHVKSI